ncbi:MAG: hypothetical protein JST59_10730 [Actinobacteria bacterium]|nr:hypothetical protein [Actinomycetota bacterium]
MKLPTTLRWVALALLGLIIAAAVALGASRLASQQIGIASESVSAGDTLAPPITPATKRGQKKSEESGAGKEGKATETTPPAEGTEPAELETEAEPPAEVPAETSSGDDESGGEGGDGGGAGGGGPDD